MNRTPSFAGHRAVVLHDGDVESARLVRRLAVLGLDVRLRWAPLDLAETPADLVLVDADKGWDGLLPWRAGEPAPVPLVALLASEAPGRIDWALDHGALALIAKPIVAATVYPALVMAVRLHAERSAQLQRVASLGERLRMRPLVHAAVAALARRDGLGEADAYRWLQGEAMRRRLALEQVAAEVAAGRDAFPEAG